MANATQDLEIAAIKTNGRNDVTWIDVALGIAAIATVIAGLIAAQYGPPVQDANLYDPASSMMLWPF